MPKPFFLFAPGAGAPSTHPWMQKWKHYLESLGEVVPFDYDYMREGRKRPDPPPQLIAAHRSALAEAREKSSGLIFLIGKSMGGRIGCHVALEEEVVGLICLGYPLCGGGDRTKLRDKVLRALQTPVLFIQGTRDPLSATNSTALGILLTFARQFDGALAYCARAAELEPNNFLVRCNLAISYGLKGMFQQAIDQYRMAGELSLDNKGDVLASIATMLTSAGRKSEADPMMPEILELAIAGKADPYNVAVLCAARGDKEEGFKWLAKAAANRQLMSGILRYDPQLDPLRSDNRFAALLRQHDRASLLENP